MFPPDVITHPYRMAKWKIENSHLVAIPDHILCDSIPSLIAIVQGFSDNAPSRPGRPQIGPITFRFEVNADLIIILVHCYFQNKSGKLVRFMRLRLIEDES